MAPFDAVLDSFRGWGRVLFHTFVGLDDACILPPTHTFIGLMPNRPSMQVPEELRTWIDGWKAKGKDRFLYVSFGSILTLSAKFANKLASLFADLGYPTIWSLRSPATSSINNPLIYHREWLPQQAILRLPEVRGYMTHCGWGSITEAISTNTPLICVPVFADQPMNAHLVVKKHIGVQIYETDNFRIPEELELEIGDGRILSGVTELMEDDSYLQAIEKMNKMSALHRTEDNIERVVRETMEFGVQHLICERYEQATVKCGQPLSKILVKDYLPQRIDH